MRDATAAHERLNGTCDQDAVNACIVSTIRSMAQQLTLRIEATEPDAKPALTPASLLSAYTKSFPTLAECGQCRQRVNNPGIPVLKLRMESDAFNLQLNYPAHVHCNQCGANGQPGDTDDEAVRNWNLGLLSYKGRF